MTERVSIATNTATLAQAMLNRDDGLDVFNAGVYPESRIRVRQLRGDERVIVRGTTAGAAVHSSESWIVDRFGALGARQIARLLKMQRGYS